MSIKRHCALWVFKFEHFHALINGFITAQTAFCHCTFSIYHCTFCASLRIEKCPAEEPKPKVPSLKVGDMGTPASARPTFSRFPASAYYVGYRSTVESFMLFFDCRCTVRHGVLKRKIQLEQ